MAKPKLKGIVQWPSIEVQWQSRLDMGIIDPSGDALDLDCSRSGQEYQVSSSMSPHVHRVPDLELVRDLQVSRLVGQLRPHFPLHSLKGFQPGI